MVRVTCESLEGFDHTEYYSSVAGWSALSSSSEPETASVTDISDEDTAGTLL